MKVCVLIMGMSENPAKRNVEAMRDTLVDDAVKLMNEGVLKHKYAFVEYKYESDSESDTDLLNFDGLLHLNYDGVESVYNTFEKTVRALRDTTEAGFDWYVRINISNMLNIRLLDRIIGVFDKDTVYCNAINTIISDTNYANDLYPRGDMIIFSDRVAKGIMEKSEPYLHCDQLVKANRIDVPHVDDCLIGLCLKDYFGKGYYEHLQMLTYNYLPQYDNLDTMNVSIYAVGSRVKTVPPGVNYSGYSWEDNEYREKDVEKMRLLMDIFKKQSYDKMQITDVLRLVKAPDRGPGSRAVLAVQYVNASVGDVKKFLKSQGK